jgi:hypothetical protein
MPQNLGLFQLQIASIKNNFPILNQPSQLRQNFYFTKLKKGFKIFSGRGKNLLCQLA